MAQLIAEFTAVGTPVPQGSTRAFAGKGKASGKVFTTNDPSGSIAKWRHDIRSAYTLLWHSRDIFVPTAVDAAISMRLVFRFARPASHYLPANSKRAVPELRADAPPHPIGGRTGDVDKLARAVLDALTAVCYVDDDQVVSCGAVKAWAGDGERPGVDVRVVAL